MALTDAEKTSRYRERHPERVRESRRRYKAKLKQPPRNDGRMLPPGKYVYFRKGKRRVIVNRDVLLARKARYRAKRRAELAEKQRQYRERPDVREHDREYFRSRSRAHVAGLADDYIKRLNPWLRGCSSEELIGLCRTLTHLRRSLKYAYRTLA